MYEHLGWYFPDFDQHFARTVSQYPSSWDTVEVDIHQLDEFEEIVLTPLPLG